MISVGDHAMSRVHPIRSEEGWESFVTGMRSAFETSPDELMVIAVAIGVIAFIWVNWKIARRLQRMSVRTG